MTHGGRELTLGRMCLFHIHLKKKKKLPVSASAASKVCYVAWFLPSRSICMMQKGESKYLPWGRSCRQKKTNLLASLMAEKVCFPRTGVASLQASRMSEGLMTMTHRHMLQLQWPHGVRQLCASLSGI